MTTSIELSQETAKFIFNIAKLEAPATITDENIRETLVLIKKIVDDASSFELIEEDTTIKKLDPSVCKKVLVVDDIGVITYQLKVLLQRVGLIVDTSKTVNGALNLIKKNQYDFIVMDLYVPSEQEGYTLLEEAKKITSIMNTDTKIVVLTASVKAEHKMKCLNRGASVFMQKDETYQDKLVSYISTSNS